MIVTNSNLGGMKNKKREMIHACVNENRKEKQRNNALDIRNFDIGILPTRNNYY